LVFDQKTDQIHRYYIIFEHRRTRILRQCVWNSSPFQKMKLLNRCRGAINKTAVNGILMSGKGDGENRRLSKNA